MHVFGRMPGYNSSEDTIVRVTVRQLRQRLELYYSAEGTANDFRIDIPKGGYVAAVERVTGKQVAEPIAITPPPSVIPVVAISERTSVRAYQVAVVLLLVLLVGVSLLWWTGRRARVAAANVSVGPMVLWQQVFTADRKTLIVPGDGGLDNYIAWEQTPIPLDQYVTQEYQRHTNATSSPTQKDVPVALRSVTPMADLAFTALLVRAADRVAAQNPEANRVEVRYARDVAVADTHDNNLILIGSESFNPWTSLYHQSMDFVERFDPAADTYTLTNKAPRQGEQKEYVYSRAHPADKEFTHLALLSNSQGVGRVLLVDGTTMGSTYGALNFLTHESLYQPVLRQATDRSGQVRDFEVVLSGNFLHGGVGNSQVVAVHLH